MSREEIRARIARKLTIDMNRHLRIDDALHHMNMIPASPDVARRELAESLVRQRLLEPIETGLAELSQLAAEVAQRTILGDHEDPDDPPDEVFAYVIESTARAIIGYLLYADTIRY